MNAMKTIITIIAFGSISACGTDADNSVARSESTANIGTFQIEIEGLVKFDNTGKRADGFNYRHDYWEFKSNGAKLRMAGRFPDDLSGVEQASIDLEYNNVYFEFMYEVDKQRTRVSCQAAQEPNGQIKRTINQNLSNSGSFEIELVLCRNTYTSETIAEIKTPITVRGWFENTPNKESLF
jgi:hypothetical protein